MTLYLSNPWLMNPWPMIRAELKALGWVAWMIALLIALAVGAGVLIGAAARAFETGTARAARDFPLVIGAPGSQSQLVLTSVYLQLDALPLLDGAILKRLQSDPRVAEFAPIVGGDSVQGYPVIGTTAAFASRWGRLAPSAGRLFSAEGEAVLGSAVALEVGSEIIPSHLPGHAHHASSAEDEAEEAAHRHAGVTYKIVGRLPATGTGWDRAILLPIESVWEAHGLSDGHAPGTERVGAPFDAETLAGVPAIVVRPRDVAAAYGLRTSYRQGGSMALFPAEILVSLYAMLGDLRDGLVTISALNALLVLAAIMTLLLSIQAGGRRRRAVLRALGAPRRYLLVVAWASATVPLAMGCLAGLPLGWLACRLGADAFARMTGLELSPGLAWGEIRFVLLALLVAAGVALLPAWASSRGSVADTLRR